MQIRFGEFPEDHHFLLIARPFVEWCFKLIGWLIVVATIKYGYEKTSNVYLLGLSIFVYLLLALFVGSFVDWVRKFQFQTGDGNGKLVHKAKLSSSPLKNAVRKYVSILLGLMFTIVAIGVMNKLTAEVIDSVIEFQRASGR